MPRAPAPPKKHEKQDSPPSRTTSVPRKMTRQRLDNIATYYVERFATTAAHLRRVLQRRIAQAFKVHGGDRQEMDGWCDAVVTRLVRAGIVDDRRYASGRAAALRRLGRSPGKIRTLLAAKGVPKPLIVAAIAETAETIDGEDAAYHAALAYARRRRLGPFGKGIADPKARREQAAKDMAALARAGFSYDIAKRVMTLTPEQAAA